MIVSSDSLKGRSTTKVRRFVDVMLNFAFLFKDFRVMGSLRYVVEIIVLLLSFGFESVSEMRIFVMKKKR